MSSEEEPAATAAAAAPQPKRKRSTDAEEEPAAAATAPPQPKRSTAEATALEQINRELAWFWRDPPPYCRPGPEPVTDPFHWEVVIDGPAGTPYAGGTFPIDIQFPSNYPFRPPKLTFKTKVYHLNIDEKGRMVLDIQQLEAAPLPLGAKG